MIPGQHPGRVVSERGLRPPLAIAGTMERHPLISYVFLVLLAIIPPVMIALRNSDAGALQPSRSKDQTSAVSRDPGDRGRAR